MVKDMLIYAGVFGSVAVVCGAVMVPPTHPAFLRVAALLGAVGAFGGACFAEAIRL